MKMYNLDGSEGKMCGNGIRCVGKFLYDHGMVDINEKDEITIETLSGIKKLKAEKCRRTQSALPFLQRHNHDAQNF